MSPELTGKGLGLEFVWSAMAFIKQKFNTVHFQLVAADFNSRAIKVYERAGYTKTGMFPSRAGKHEIDFLVMRHSVDQVYKY